MKPKSSNRSFGLLFFVVFFIVGLWPLINSDPIRIWALSLSLIFLILGVINSKLLNPLNFYWIRFGEILGKVIAPIIMLIVFFIILTPIGIVLRLFGKDLLKLKKSKFLTSYWVSRKKINSMDRQF